MTIDKWRSIRPSHQRTICLIMNKKITLIIFLLLSFQVLKAQEKTDSLSPLVAKQPRLIIKWAPLSLIDPHSTVQLGAEYLMGNAWSVQQEIGYGRNFEVLATEDYHDREIWRFRTEFRKYTDEFRSKGTGPYTAFEVLYKRINYAKEGRIGRDCADGGCEYAMITDYTLLKDVIGIHVKFGGQFVVENRLVIDIYMGGGLRNITVKASGYPSIPELFLDEETRFIKSNVTMPGNHTMLSMSGGFKLGYLIYNKNKQSKLY